MGVSKATVHCWIVASTICVHCTSLKPILTEENKWARVENPIHFRDPEDPTKYQDMRDWIHLDEKWFSEEGAVSPSPRGGKPKMVHKTQIAYHKGNVLMCSCEALI